MELNSQHSIPSLGGRSACELGSTWPTSSGKSDRGVKNEPGRAGARKARKIKSNLDPDLKGIRLRGARHLDILSTACHTGLAFSTRSEGKWSPNRLASQPVVPTTRLPSNRKCLTSGVLWGWRIRTLASVTYRKERGGAFLEEFSSSQCSANIRNMNMINELWEAELLRNKALHLAFEMNSRYLNM